MAESTITEALSRLHVVAPTYHRTPPLGNTSMSEENNISASNQRQKTYEDDTQAIEHGLSVDEVRVLFRILAKEYEDCGRKRGAILRYIKSYHKPKEKLGQSLYQKLRRL